MKKRMARGKEFQRWVKRWMEGKGWMVFNSTMRPRWVPGSGEGRGVWVSKNNDIFGCVDLIGKKEGRRTAWIQATMDGHVERRIEKLGLVPWWEEADAVFVFMKRGDCVRILNYMDVERARGFGVEVEAEAGWVLVLVGEVRRGKEEWHSKRFEDYFNN